MRKVIGNYHHSVSGSAYFMNNTNLTNGLMTSHCRGHYTGSARFSTISVCLVPAATFTALSIAFADSTQTISRQQSGCPISPILPAFSVHGVHTTVERLPDLATWIRRFSLSSSITHSAAVLMYTRSVSPENVIAP